MFVLSFCSSFSACRYLFQVDPAKTRSSGGQRLNVDPSSALAVEGSGKRRQSSPVFGSKKSPKDRTSLVARLADRFVENGTRVEQTQLASETFFGLPARVRQVLRESRGVEELYQWQTDCLNHAALRDGKNLLIHTPTGGGKTLLAEILILKQLLCARKDVLLVLPFVSIVQEKVKGLVPLGLEFEFLVEEYAASKGRIPPIKRRRKKCVFVATIEKAQSLVQSLIESKRIEDLGLTIVDEVHMLGEGGSRGATLEQMLSKLLFVVPHCQLIGISATLSNISDLQTFLKAELFTTSFRPKKLANDPDNILGLVCDVIPAGSCLIFCPTKKNCENLCKLLSDLLPSEFLALKVGERQELVSKLREECDGNLCPVLEKCLPYGVAYHHSGLTVDERKLIQDAYLDGTLLVICCTSTLAAGVNLPAKRVILRSPLVGYKFLSKQQYTQMVGRAGRAGLDTSGESVLVINQKQRIQAQELLYKSVERVESSLLHNGGRGLKHLILSVAALELIHGKHDLLQFLEQTLFYIQHKENSKDLADQLENALRYLVKTGMLKLNKVSDGEESPKISFSITNIGKAVFKSGVDIDLAATVYNDLRSVTSCLCLSSQFHLLYCLVPYDLVGGFPISWDVFYDQLGHMSADEKKVLERMSVTEAFVVDRKLGATLSRNDRRFRICSRLYLAMILNHMFKGGNVWTIADRFQVTRGFVQSLVQSAAGFGSSLLRFVENLEELWALKSLLPDFVKQVAYCAHGELIPLMEIAGVKKGRALQLLKNGFKSVSAVANSSVAVLVRSIPHLSRTQAKQMISSAKMIMHEKIEMLLEEAEFMIGGASDVADVSVDDIVATLRQSV